MQPVEPLGPGRVRRAARLEPERPESECGNRAVLATPRQLCRDDLETYELTAYGTCAALDAALDNLLAAGFVLRGGQAPDAELSELAGLLASSLRQVNDRAPLPFVEVDDPGALRRPHSGLLNATLLHLADTAVEARNLTQEGMRRAHGDAGAQLFDAWSAAVPRRRGLAWLQLHARLPLIPTDETLPPTRGEILACRRHDVTALDRMVEFAAIPEHLDALDVAAGLIPAAVFDGFAAVCVQHVLGSQVPTFAVLARKGLLPQRVEIVGAPYSTSFVAEHALRQRGYAVDTPEPVPHTDIDSVIDLAVRQALRRAIQRARPNERILVLDDGGKALLAVHDELAAEAHRFCFVEQTTRGITEIASLQQCRVPVVDVARAPLKRHESRTIGDEICRRVDALLERLGLAAVDGQPVLVIGYGMIGSGVAEGLRRRGARVTVHDINAQRRNEAHAAGLAVEPELHKAVAGRHLIVGCSGKRTIGPEVMQYLGPETVLASASSRQIEIDMQIGRAPGVRARALSVEGPGDDRYVTWLWRLAHKDVVVLHNGFPLNFTGALETTTMQSIAQTRALMLLGAAQAAGSREPGIHPLARRTQEALAAALEPTVADG